MVNLIRFLAFMFPLPALADDPFDPLVAGSIFAIFFIGVVGSFLVAKNIGLILEAIRRW